MDINSQSFLFFQKMKILKQFTFFDNYGKMAQFYYNFDCLYSPRQNHAGEQGKAYVVSSYNILLHKRSKNMQNYDNIFFLGNAQVVNKTQYEQMFAAVYMQKEGLSGQKD